MRQACSLAADLAGLTAGDAAVWLALPAEPADAVVAALASAADTAGARIIDATPTTRWRRPGSDAASDLAAGLDPSVRAAEHAIEGALDVRLSDWDGVQRVAVGSSDGRLDTRALLLAVSLAATTDQGAAMTIDARGLRHPRAAIEASLSTVRAFESAGV